MVRKKVLGLKGHVTGLTLDVMVEEFEYEFRNVREVLELHPRVCVHLLGCDSCRDRISSEFYSVIRQEEFEPPYSRLATVRRELDEVLDLIEGKLDAQSHSS